MKKSILLAAPLLVAMHKRFWGRLRRCDACCAGGSPGAQVLGNYETTSVTNWDRQKPSNQLAFSETPAKGVCPKWFPQSFGALTKRPSSGHPNTAKRGGCLRKVDIRGYQGRPYNYNFLVLYKLYLLGFGDLLNMLYRNTHRWLRDASLFRKF